MLRKALMGVAAGAAMSLSAVSAQAADIVDTAMKAGQFNTLVAAVKAAGLVDTLKGKGPFTVFAPTDAAFKKLPPGTVEKLLEGQGSAHRDPDLSRRSRRVMSADIKGKMIDRPRPFRARRVSIDATKGKVMVNNATVVTADVKADNGVIHVIDTVIMPK